MAGIKDIARGAGVTSSQVQDVFEEVLTLVKKGHRVRVIGFGTFEKKTFPGRKLTTPAVNDGKPFRFPDSFRLSFKQSQQAKRRLNMKKKKKGTKKKVVKKKTGKKKVKKRG